MSFPRGGRDYPRTLPEFARFFPDDVACHQYLVQLRWPGGFVCPACQQTSQLWLVRRRKYRCRRCRTETAVTSGTIFHRTHVPLRLWFLAAWELTSTKHGTTALDLQRQLGLKSYATAWLLGHKLRAAMVRPHRELLSGTVEADETYVGGEEAGRKGRGALTKAIVALAVEVKRQHLGRVRLRHVPDLTAHSLAGFVRDVVAPGSAVHTDGWQGYKSLSPDFRHEVTVVTAVNDPTHVALPGVHRVASLLKRWLLGVEQGGIAREHLPAYLEEFTFRFNRRTSKARGLLFCRLLEQAVVTPPVPLHQVVKHTGRGRRRRGGLN